MSKWFRSLPPRLLRAGSALCLFAICGMAHAQTYTPDSSSAVASAFPWIDIAGSGTKLPLADDDYSSNINIGFTFTYGGTDYTRLRVAANGMLFFAGTSGDYTNSALPLTGGSGEPNIDAVMSPLWDDLQPNSNGNYIRYDTIGSAPNRVFVVSWLAVPYYCYTNNSTCNGSTHQTRYEFATFQVQIYEQGQFVYRYGDVDGNGGTHTSGPTLSDPYGATIGYELTNSDYVQYSFRSASVPNGTTILWSRPSAAPGGFNAFETATAAGSITGVLHTKVAGSAFSAAVVALNSARNGLATSFSGDVKVELLDTSNNGGALDASTGCRSSWTSVLQTTTITFASGDAGRHNVTLTEANAWRDVRLRMRYPATGTATVIGCSTDDLAIRPSAFSAFAATDATWSTAGTARTLANAAVSGGIVHKAGQPFTVRATAVNAASATTTNYNGAPTATMSKCAGTACTTSFGALNVSLTASGGQISDSAATYSEVGAFALQLNDADFASVDGADGSTTAERTITSPTITVGRFVPDHFDLATLVTPVLRTFGSASCAGRSFTYVGQPFGFATAPQATVLARNAAGATTALYAGSLWKLASAGITQTYAPLAPASPGLDVSLATLPALTSSSNGTGVLATSSADTLSMVRSATTPLAPFAAAITMNWSVADTSEAGVTGNGSIATAVPLSFGPMAFDAGNTFRWGVLQIANAYGSDLHALPVAVQALYWDGLRFATNAADQCTSLPTGAVAMGNYQRHLAACDTAIAPATITLASGRAFITLVKPGAGHDGSTDLGVQLGATASGQTCTAVGAAPVAATAAQRPWLLGKWSGATAYDRNPVARASFGQYKSPLIWMRESF